MGQQGPCLRQCLDPIGQVGGLCHNLEEATCPLGFFAIPRAAFGIAKISQAIRRRRATPNIPQAQAGDAEGAVHIVRMRKRTM